MFVKSVHQEGKVVGELVLQEARLPASAIEDTIKERLAEQLVSAVDYLVRSPLLGRSVGDVSVRIPGTDQLLAAPHVLFLEQPSVNELLEVTMNGKILRRRKHPSFELQMHLAIYKQWPDVQAIVHSHAPMAIVLGLCELPIPPVTFDSVPFIDLPRVPASISRRAQWPQEVAASLADGAPGALLLHHGIVTVGADLQQAIRRTLALEETARILVTAHLLQQVPATLPSEAVEILTQTSL